MIFLLLIILGIYFLLKSRYENLEIMSSVAYLVAIMITFVFIIKCGGRIIRWIRPHPIIFVDRAPEIDDIPLHQNVVGEIDIGVIFDKVHLPMDKPQIKEILAKFNKIDIVQDNAQNGECGVCYEELEGKLLGCPECHKVAHKSCLKEWIESGQSLCIYCRHDFS